MQTNDVYKRSRFLYIIEAAVEYFIAILVGTTYLAKLTTSIGISDGVTGVLTSFISLGFGFQIFALFIPSKIRIKRIVIILHLINEFSFTVLYLVPVISISKTSKTVIFIALLLLAEIVKNTLYSPKMTWLMGLVDDNKRGTFTARKEIVSLISGMVVSFAMGSVIDFFEAKNDLNTAFILSAITVAALTLIHCAILFSIKETKIAEKSEPIGIMLKSAVTDKNLLKLIPLFALWNVATYITTPFLGTYQLGELGFNMKSVAIISILYAVVRAVFSAPIGKIADKYSFVNMMSICFAVAALGFLFNIFFGKAFFILYYVCYAVSQAGINSGTVNLLYDYVPHEKRTGALAIKNTVVGFVGFGSTLAAKPLVDYVQSNGNTLFGIPLYAQQALSLISTVVTVAVIIYLNTVVRKMKKEIA
jgi:MFS family permease